MGLPRWSAPISRTPSTTDFPADKGPFDVPGFINAVLAIGWDGPWGIEQMSGDFRRLPVRDALTRGPRRGTALLRSGSSTSRRGSHTRG